MSPGEEAVAANQFQHQPSSLSTISEFSSRFSGSCDLLYTSRSNSARSSRSINKHHDWPVKTALEDWQLCERDSSKRHFMCRALDAKSRGQLGQGGNRAQFATNTLIRGKLIRPAGHVNEQNPSFLLLTNQSRFPACNWFTFFSAPLLITHLRLSLEEGGEIGGLAELMESREYQVHRLES